MRTLLSTETRSISGSGNLAAMAFGFVSGIAAAALTTIACILDPTIPERFEAYRESLHKKNELNSTQVDTLPTNK